MLATMEKTRQWGHAESPCWDTCCSRSPRSTSALTSRPCTAPRHARDQGSGQTDRQTRRQTHGQTDRHEDRQTDRYEDRQTDRHEDRQTDRQTDTKTDRQIRRQTDRQTDRRTRRHIDNRTQISKKAHGNIQKNKEIEYEKE